jgi:RNA 3'-terminal phosphate cyclase
LIKIIKRIMEEMI